MYTISDYTVGVKIYIRVHVFLDALFVKSINIKSSRSVLKKRMLPTIPENMLN